MFRYIDNIHSLNASRFGDHVDRIYPTDTATSASYIDLHLEIRNYGWLRINLYDKRNFS
jgi:hypothetical protein